MNATDKKQLFRALVHEAKDGSWCVVCGRLLRNGAGRRKVKCQTAECLRGYNAMYRRLKRSAP